MTAHAPIPAALAARLREVGVVILTPPKPAQPAIETRYSETFKAWVPILTAKDKDE